MCYSFTHLPCTSTRAWLCFPIPHFVLARTRFSRILSITDFGAKCGGFHYVTQVILSLLFLFCIFIWVCLIWYCWVKFFNWSKSPPFLKLSIIVLRFIAYKMLRTFHYFVTLKKEKLMVVIIEKVITFYKL